MSAAGSTKAPTRTPAKVATRADAKWVSRALALARRGEALASPNPMVGAVLVVRGRVVGEGFHTYAGVHHAEVLALRQAGRAARGATLYVNLEPCCHTGRTGPCTRAIIAAGVSRVVAAMPDPNPAVAGRGFDELRAAGIAVLSGVLQDEARRLNEAFARWITARRPFVTLKSALTSNGQLVLPPALSRRKKLPSRGVLAAKRRLWITSAASRQEVQRMRHASDALLTGIGTVLIDDPRLSDRTGLPRRRPLLRVVLDSRLRLSPRSNLVCSARGDVLVFTCASDSGRRAKSLRRAGIEVVRISPSKVPNAPGVALARGAARVALRRVHPMPDLRAVLTELGRRGMLSVLLEAGSTLNDAAVAAGLVDKVRLFYAPKVVGRRQALPSPKPPRSASSLGVLTHIRIEQFGPDVSVEGYLHDVYRR
jgi:diaminohydroxyphosphoribosylaminopyrimidine deaminase/5-amino-6-(5-phosphoribosylamino)uracil reductase